VEGVCGMGEFSANPWNRQEHEEHVFGDSCSYSFEDQFQVGSEYYWGIHGTEVFDG
jgi:hypothetical protein